MRELLYYKNYIKPRGGFNPDVINDLRKKTASLSPMERYATTLLSKLKTSENLMWDKHSGELIGFVDLDEICTSYATLKNRSEII